MIDRAEQSPEGARASERERRERARLLYVGFTRARDHLVPAVRRKRRRWLDELADAKGNPLLGLPLDVDKDGLVEITLHQGDPTPVRVICCDPEAQTTRAAEATTGDGKRA